MKTIDVIIQEDGKTAKELNPFACYGTGKPHPMDFDDHEEFEHRLHKWYEAEEKIKMFYIESVSMFGDIVLADPNYLKILSGHINEAEILENGKLKLLWK